MLLSDQLGPKPLCFHGLFDQRVLLERGISNSCTGRHLNTELSMRVDVYQNLQKVVLSWAHRHRDITLIF